MGRRQARQQWRSGATGQSTIRSAGTSCTLSGQTKSSDPGDHNRKHQTVLKILNLAAPVLTKLAILQRAGLLMLLTGFLSAAHAEITEVDNEKLKTLIQQGVPVIDVRRADEWQQTGIIEGSHLLTFFDRRGNYDVQAWLNELNRIAPDDQPFVLICAVGGRTGSISKLLDRKLGYTGVHNVTRGIRGWIRAGEQTQPWSP